MLITAEFLADQIKAIEEELIISFPDEGKSQKIQISATIVARQIAILDSFDNSLRIDSILRYRYIII